MKTNEGGTKNVTAGMQNYVRKKTDVGGRRIGAERNNGAKMKNDVAVTRNDARRRIEEKINSANTNEKMQNTNEKKLRRD